MKIFYVFQNQSKKQELNGKYLWSPQKKLTGENDLGYINMSKVQKGDLIFHGANQETFAISIAQSDCYEAKQPEELKKLKSQQIWNNKGYMVDCDYNLLTPPLDMRQHREWLKEHQLKGGPFNSNGSGNQRYLSQIDLEHAKYLLTKIKETEKFNKTKAFIHALLTEAIESDLDYDHEELDEINSSLDDFKNESFIESEKPENIELTISNNTGIPRPKRNNNKAKNALKKANFKCENDISHKLFLRKDGKYEYTEPHHLIPLSKDKEFEYSLDVTANIVSLCSHCHNLLHYGRLEDKMIILEKLYNERKDLLSKKGISISFEQLLDYYK